MNLNPLNAKLNPICYLLVLLGAHHILHISRIRVKERGCGAMDCIYLAQGKDNGQWTLVNVLLNHYIL